MSCLKNEIRKRILGYKVNSETYIEHLRSQGMVIGDNCYIYTPTKVVIDETRPWLIEMGNNVLITEGVSILTHGYDWGVFKGLTGDVLGSAGRVKIGSNVFIGIKSIILKDVTIGDNVIIGAGSLINKDVPDNCVVAGNPQRIICTLSDYYAKRKSAQLNEALVLYRAWRRNSPMGKSGLKPPKSIFREFFWLFEDRQAVNAGYSDESFEWTMNLRGTYDKSVQRFLETEQPFKNYEIFLEYLEKRL